MLQSRWVVWLAGFAVAGGAAFGAYYHLRPPPASGTEPESVACCGDDEPTPDSTLSLPESERTYLWDIEHGGNILVQQGFGPLAAALRSGDAPALRALCSPGFQGHTLRQPRQVAWHRDGLNVVRQMTSGLPPLPLDRDTFVERLLDYRRRFAGEPRVKIALMKLAPVERLQLDGPWQGTCQLRLWGEKAPGQPAEVIVYLSYQVVRPTKAGLAKGGWLNACAIDQSQVGDAPGFLLREVAVARGLDVAALHDNWKTGPADVFTGGVYLCDFDRDGILNVLVTDVNGNWLYKGLPDGTFRDVTTEMGLPRRCPIPPDHAYAAAFIDIDGDGWEDLILYRSVYRNEGGKQFSNVTSRCNLGLPAEAVGFAVADYDRDGRPDVYVVIKGATRWRGFLDDQSGKGNHLWRNKGNWQFEEVTGPAGASGGHRSSFTALWLDANNDGWPDLYVPNEFGNGALLINQGDGTFKEHLLVAGPSDYATMGAAAGDIDNDGQIDLYLANMYSKAGKRVIGNLRPDTYPQETMAHLHSLVAGSQLHRNKGNLQFEQKGQEWQVADCGWAHGAALIDLDNDGWLDLHASAGFISRDRTKPDG